MGHKLLVTVLSVATLGAAADTREVFNTHPVTLDAKGKLEPWYGPAGKAYDHFLRQRWEYIKTKAPVSPGPAPRSSYPHYYFYCEYKHKDGGMVLDQAFMILIAFSAYALSPVMYQSSACVYAAALSRCSSLQP